MAVVSNVLFGAASTLVTVPQMPDMKAEAARRLPGTDAEGFSKRRTNLVPPPLLSRLSKQVNAVAPPGRAS
jgi:hypothetical protein